MEENGHDPSDRGDFVEHASTFGRRIVRVLKSGFHEMQRQLPQIESGVTSPKLEWERRS